MSLHVQLIAKKFTWFGAVKLIHSHLSFLCCLFLNPVINRGVSVFSPHFWQTLHRVWPKSGGTDNGLGCMKCIHRVWLPSCVSIQLLETTKLQKFPLSYQVFRYLASQKQGNFNKFEPSDLFGSKDELWGTTQELFCEFFCYVWNHTDLISLWGQTGFSV